MSPAGKAASLTQDTERGNGEGLDGLHLSLLIMTLLHPYPTLTLDEVIRVTLESFEQLLSSRLKEGGVELAPLSPRGTCDYCKSSDLYFMFSYFLLVMFISGCHSNQM